MGLDRRTAARLVSEVEDKKWAALRAEAALTAPVVQGGEQPVIHNQVAEFLKKTNEECRQWMATYYSEDAIERNFLISLWAWQEQERRYAAAQPVEVPDGWKLVPITPTPEMIEAGNYGDCGCPCCGKANYIYEEIINASPEYKPNSKEES